ASYRRLPITIAAIAASTFILIAATGVRAQDDWSVVERHTIEHAPPADAFPSENSVPQADSQSRQDQPQRHEDEPPARQAQASRKFLVCGEEATRASPNVQQMVATIDQSWHADVRVYQSVRPLGPHAMPGGCIFYNAAVLKSLLKMRLDLQNQQDLDPLLWAIFAHEVGHEVHEDFSAARAKVPNQQKELEADRFAGYTLEKLNIRAVDIAPYWSLAGDEFGAGPSHGTSAQRVAAFKEGWHEAEWRRLEDAQSVGSAMDEPVAPEDSASAPQ
ncbi:MAG: hypothetical protein ACREQN_08875, partial [Candidatus Binataceae bacterium]